MTGILRGAWRKQIPSFRQSDLHIAYQLGKSASSIGANYREANRAEAASHGTWLLVVTDLDAAVSPNEIGKQWLGVDCLGKLPERFIFRIAVREIESWIMADNLGLAEYLHVPSGNITIVPDALPDPKQELLRIIREKCKMKKLKNMLPIGNQHVGIDYNRHLCEFVDTKWNLDLARQHSPSLERSVVRMVTIFSQIN